jgi:DNA-binding CsgD family transcriptional regulator
VGQSKETEKSSSGGENPPPDLSLSEFMEKFERDHPDFLKNLLKKNRDFHDVEYQISALLVFGFERKKIPRILSVTKESVNNHCSDIRKKLRLERKADLVIELKKILKDIK